MGRTTNRLTAIEAELAAQREILDGLGADRLAAKAHHDRAADTALGHPKG